MMNEIVFIGIVAAAFIGAGIGVFISLRSVVREAENRLDEALAEADRQLKAYRK